MSIDDKILPCSYQSLKYKTACSTA